MKRTLIVLALLCFQFKNSQNMSGVENFLLASEEDKNLLVNSYFSPLFKSLQVSMNEGWSRSAKTHKKFGFDLTFFASAVEIPDSEKSFDISGFNNLTSSSNTSPTIFGQETNESFSVDFQPAGEEYTISANFPAANGYGTILKEGRMILPNIQFSLGLPFKTDLILRYIPDSKFKGAKLSSLGFGVKHSLMQYFKPGKVLPLNIAVLATHSSTNGSYNFGVNSQIQGSNQGMNLDVNSFSYGVVGSLDLKVFSIYSSFSKVNTKSEFKINGNYVLNYSSSISGNQSIQVSVTDPVSIENKLDYLKKNVGVSLNFPGIKFFLDYTIHNYNSVNAGVSIGLR